MSQMPTRTLRWARRLLARETGLREEAFVHLYTRQLEPVFNYVRYRLGPWQAEDVTAEIFARAWERRGQYDPARGSAEAWLWGIARHAVTDRLRRPSPVQSRLPPDLADRADPAEAVEEREMREQLQRAMARLPAIDQEIIALRFGAGFPHRAIAGTLGLSEANVAQRLRRALRKLRNHLEGGEGR